MGTEVGGATGVNGMVATVPVKDRVLITVPYHGSQAHGTGLGAALRCCGRQVDDFLGVGVQHGSCAGQEVSNFVLIGKVQKAKRTAL